MKKTTVDQIATKIPVVDLVPLCRRTQYPIHRADRTQIGAFIQQGGKDLSGRLIRKAGFAQMVQHLLPLASQLSHAYWHGGQIVGILQEYAAGAKVSELCRKHGMSDATLYKWKAKYGGMTVSELRRLKDLEAENSELKRLLADAMLDNAGLKGLLAKNS